MKLYEYIKSKNSRTLKVLGFTIMRKIFSVGRSTQRFLGLVTVTKEGQYSLICRREIKILGYRCVCCDKIDDNLTCSIFGKTICKISLFNIFTKRFKKQYFTYFDKQYDDIYLLFANSGEIYLTLTHCIDAFIKKNKSKNPLLVAAKKYHCDIIKSICPDIPYIYISGMIAIDKKKFQIDPFRFFVLYNSSYFMKVESDIKNNDLGKCHYFKSLLENLGLIDDDLSYRKIIVSPKDERSMLDKVTKTGLNLNRFILLAPESQSAKLYDKEFWVMLINALQDRGYDVFVNLTSDQIKLEGARDFKVCDLSFIEAFALAKYSKKIVTLRSGFTEFLLQTNVPMDILYTKFKWQKGGQNLDASHVMAGFGISQISFFDQSKIREFDTSKITPEGLLKTILKEL